MKQMTVEISNAKKGVNLIHVKMGGMVVVAHAEAKNRKSLADAIDRAVRDMLELA